MQHTHTLKAALLISGLFLFGGTDVNAQEKKKGHPADRVWVALNVAKLNMQLDLNDEQQARVKEIDERYMKKHQALEAMVPKLTEQQMGDKVGSLMKDRDNDMMNVLNADQYAKWSEMRQKGMGELDKEQQQEMDERKK